MNYQSQITADEITVIFNGTTYTVPRNANDGDCYGTIDLIDDSHASGDYPFCIVREGGVNYVYVTYDVYANHNPFTIKIVSESVTTAPCFDKARGYWCEEEIVTLTEESVTAEAGKDDDWAYGELTYSQLIDADNITVTFDAVEYECPRWGDDLFHLYGAPWNDSTQAYDWSEYPFVIGSNAEDGNYFYTETAGTYSIKIQAVEVTATTTPCFEKAVKAVIPPSDSIEVPAIAYRPIVFNLTSEGTVTVPANDGASLTFPSTGSAFSNFAVIRSINIPNNLLISNFYVGRSGVSVNVYNVTSSPITVTNAQLSLVDFVEVEAMVCVTEGTSCGGGK